MPDTRTRLLNAALHRYGKHGFHETSTAQVAAEAEVSPGTLFRHFPTKEALVHAADAHAQARLSGHGPGSVPRTTVYGFLRGHWEATIERALREEDAFRYWALYGATPGYGRPEHRAHEPGLGAPVGGVRLRLWQGLGPFLARALAEREALAAFWATLLEAQWTAAVQALLNQSVLDLSPATRAFAVRVFDGWWATLGLDRTAPFPPEAPPAP